MKNSRPRIKYSQTPHSIARFIESITNPTATALLSLLTRKTVGFGQGFVDLSYRQIAKALGVGARTITRASKILEKLGVIQRERAAGGVYRWRIVLQHEEVLEDPTQTYTVAGSSQGGDKIDLSGGIGSIDQEGPDRSVMTSFSETEHADLGENKPEGLLFEQKPPLLKKLIKDKDLKKQHQEFSPKPVSSAPLEPQSTSPKLDDEPLHKICLRKLREHGVSSRMARKLCNNHPHDLILSVVKAAAQRPGVQNLPAYIVSEIQDGGYTEQQTTAPPARKRTSTLPKIQSPPTAPVTYRSPEQTQQELLKLESEKLAKEKSYKKQGCILAKRFQELAEEVQLHLKLLASVQLTRDLPQTGNREQMLKDKTFQRVANRTVLERFFTWLDKGLNTTQALSKLENSYA
mgnify:CR=1 FL=1